MRTTFIALACALALAACDEDTPDTDAGCTTCGTDSGTTGTDSGTPGTDSGTPGTDAGSDMDAGGGDEDAGGGDPDSGTPATDSGILGADAMVGADCTYNYDCAADQRCVGDDDAGTRTCQLGARGTSLVGEACDDDSECESGNCYSNNGIKACSVACETEADDSSECGGLFPDCVYVPFTGTVCADSDT